MPPTTSWDRRSPSTAVSAPPDAPARALLPRGSYCGVGGRQAHPRHQERRNDRGFPSVSLSATADDAGRPPARIDDPAGRLTSAAHPPLYPLLPAPPPPDL